MWPPIGEPLLGSPGGSRHRWTKWAAEIYCDVLQLGPAVTLQTGDTGNTKWAGSALTSPYNSQLYCFSLWLDIQHLQLIKTKQAANILTSSATPVLSANRMDNLCLLMDSIKTNTHSALSVHKLRWYLDGNLSFFCFLNNKITCSRIWTKISNDIKRPGKDKTKIVSLLTERTVAVHSAHTGPARLASTEQLKKF